MTSLSIPDYIVPHVRINIDEIALNDAEFDSGLDEGEMDTIIKDKAVEALRFIILHADARLLEPTGYYSATATADDVTSGHVDINLGTTFLRMLYAESSVWPYPVTDVIPFDTEDYKKLSHKLTMGTYQKPCVGLRWTYPNSSNARDFIAELYGPKAADNTFNLVYVSEPQITNNTLAVPDKLEDALIYYISGLTLLTLRDGQADAMFNQAMLLMGIPPQVSQEAEDSK